MRRKHHCGKAETTSYRIDALWAVVADNRTASTVSNCSKNVSPKTGHRAQKELITRVSKLLAGRPDKDMQKDSAHSGCSGLSGKSTPWSEELGGCQDNPMPHRRLGPAA